MSGDVIQAQPAHINGNPSRGQGAENSQNGLDMHSIYLDVKVCGGGMVMTQSLREIHIKICPAWIVMYSQRHVLC